MKIHNAVRDYVCISTELANTSDMQEMQSWVLSTRCATSTRKAKRKGKAHCFNIPLEGELF